MRTGPLGSKTHTIRQKSLYCGKTPAIRWQNLRHKAAKVCTALSKFFSSAHQKNSISTAKIAIIHTFSGFDTLSELLAHCLGGMLLS